MVTVGSFSEKLQQKDRWTQVRGPEFDCRKSLV